MAEYPEHDKLLQVVKKSQATGEFLEWLLARYTICELGEDDTFYPAFMSIQDLLAEYYGIDRKKLEDEKQAMYRALRGEVGDG